MVHIYDHKLVCPINIGFSHAYLFGSLVVTLQGVRDRFQIEQCRAGSCNTGVVDYYIYGTMFCRYIVGKGAYRGRRHDVKGDKLDNGRGRDKASHFFQCCLPPFFIARCKLSVGSDTYTISTPERT